MIWIIGAGYMAQEYCKVLKNLNKPFKVIGRGPDSAASFREITGIPVVTGGLTAAINSTLQLPTFAIITTPVECLAEQAKELIRAGVKNILVEKPAALKIEDLEEINRLSILHQVKICIGYNRRFYQSTLAAEKFIENDGGLIAVNFEISEWAHVVEKEIVNINVKNNWLLANTSHVIDLVFFMAGMPEQITCYSSGSLEWHTSSSRFVGSGMTEKGALFSYLGCWDGPGRWVIEFITRENRYYFKPMEKLMVQKKGSIEVCDSPDINYELDVQFKPGLFLQVNAFLNGDLKRFCSFPEQIKAFKYYKKIAAY